MTTTTTDIYKSVAGKQAVMAVYDEVLERWPVPFATINVPTRHGDTFVIHSGNEQGRPLLLLHGAGGNSAMWAGDVAAYGRDHPVYAIDLIGEAGKSAPNRPAWEGPAFEEWLGDIINYLESDKPTLIGISQGAWAALKYAVAHPEHVDRLILISPGGIVPDRLSFILRAVAASLLGRGGVRRMVRLLYASQDVPAGVEEITALIMENFRSRVGVLPLFPDEALSRLTMPVLLLGGDEDALRDMRKIAERLRPLLPRLTVTIIPGGGHALLNTAPHILSFLAATAPAYA